MHVRASVSAHALGPILALLALPVAAAITINGTTGSDVIDVSSSSEAHLIFAKKGADVVYGSSAGDVLDGGSGNDRLYGNDGNDVTIGGAGNDVMLGGIGDDQFQYAGTEIYFDEIDGGSGLDTVVGSGGDDVIGIRVQPVSVEQIDGRGGFDIIRLPDSGSRSLNLSSTVVLSIELIQGGTGHDTITGSPGDDTVRGGSGNDVINGGPGRDSAVYLGESESYQITWGTPTVVRALAGSEGTDQLTGVEVMAFADGQFEDGTFIPKYPDNTPPVATPDSAVVPEDSQVEINLLVNDFDPDSDPIGIVAIGNPSHGTVKALATGSVLYAPRADFHGTDTFSYRIADDKYGKTYGAVTVTVTPQPDSPIARADLLSAVADRAYTIRPLVNDTDPDGDTIKLQGLGKPLHGTAVAQPDGTLRYVAPAGFSGKDLFTYTIVDATGLTAAGTVTVDVIGSGSFGELMGVLAAAPEGSWVKLNKNLFSSVWTPKDQRPCFGYNQPSRVITAWGSMAFDSNRGDLIFWGGGHKNYCGNEVYRFRLSTLQWERASLPSAIYDPLGDKQYAAVDGPLSAPTASHTYDNQEFMPQIDRFITFGGAKYNLLARFVLLDGKTPTGPYIWDPSRANMQLVGGTTGSHVNPSAHPAVFGGEMWDNRNTVRVRGFSPVRPDSNFVNGTTAYARHMGKDVVYVTLQPDSSGKLFRYTIHDVADPDQDTWELVGVKHAAYTGKGAGAFDASRNMYVRSTGGDRARGFLAWDLNKAGPTNTSIRISAADLSSEFPTDGLPSCGMDYDGVRRAFAIWCTGRDVWYLTPPNVFGDQGWTLARAPVPDPTSEAPPARELTNFAGVLGKWKYARRFDVFLGVFEGDTGNVYAYKPLGWQPE